MIRRAMISGRQANECHAPWSNIHSSTNARALARVMAVSAARRCRNQLKVSNASAHSTDGGSISKGERPSQMTTLPASANWPA